MRMTERDAKLLEDLSGFGVLSTAQIAKLFFAGIKRTTISRRLRMIEKAKLIKRVEGLPEGMLCWITTDEGNKAVGSGYPVKFPNKNSLEHDLRLVDLKLSLNQVGLFESWQPEHYLKATRPALRSYEKEHEPVPDALLVARRPWDKEERFKFPTVAVELELTQKERGRYRSLFEHYQKRDGLFAVWYFVPTISLGRTIEEVWNSMPYSIHRKPFLLVTPINEALKDPRSMLDYSRKEKTLISKIFNFSPPLEEKAA